MDEVLRLIIHILTGTAAAAAIVFCVFYLRSPWRKNVTGRNTMAFMGAVAVVLTIAVLFRLAHTPLPLWLSVLLWLAINWPLWWRVIILWRVQHQPYQPAIHACTTCGQPCAGG